MATAPEFRSELYRLFRQAELAGKPWIDVRAGDLHERVQRLNLTPTLRMPNCCRVMRQEQRHGDTVVSDRASDGSAFHRPLRTSQVRFTPNPRKLFQTETLPPIVGHDALDDRGQQLKRAALLFDVAMPIVDALHPRDDVAQHTLRNVGAHASPHVIKVLAVRRRSCNVQLGIGASARFCIALSSAPLLLL